MIKPIAALFSLTVAIVLFIVPSVMAAWPSNLNTGLQNYWNMDEGTGTNVVNQINASGNGTLQGAGSGWIAGKLGNATNYSNPTGNYMSTVTYLPAGNTDKSVSLWFGIMGNYADGQDIFSGGTGAEGAFFALHYDYSFPNHDLYFFGWGGPSFQVLGPGALTLGAWHHAVITYDSATGNTTVWIDGVPKSNIATLTTGSTQAINIARYGTTAYANAFVDEVATWNRVLNISEAAQLYNSGTGITYEPPPPPTPIPPYSQTDFPKCRNITVEGGTAALTNFPFYIQVNKSVDMQATYADVRFANGSCWSNGTLLPYEFDYTNTSDAGVWIKANLSTGSNMFSMYYGNSTAVNMENSSTVWYDYISVYHFSEGSGGSASDSANKGNTGQVSNTTMWNTTVIGFGGSLKYDNSKKYVLSTNNITEIFNNTNRSIMFWYTAPLPATFRCAVSFGATGGGEMEQAFGDIDGVGNQNRWMLASNPSFTYTNKYMNASPTFIAFDHWDNYTRTYQQGSFDSPIYNISYNTPMSPLIIGGVEYLPATGYWNGSLDEVRISNKTFTLEYYVRTDENTNFSKFAFGDEQGPPTNVITLYDIITPHGFTSNSSILIQYNISAPPSVGMSQIKFSWNGTNYSLYDSSLILLFNFDNRSSLGEGQTKVVDLSQYSNNGTNNGEQVITNGNFNGAYNFTYNNAAVNLTVPHSKSLNFSQQLTFSFWMNRSSQNCVNWEDVINKLETGGNFRFNFYLTTTSGCSFKFRFSNSTGQIYDDAGPPSCISIDSNWHQYAVAYNFSGKFFKYYRDGSLIYTRVLNESYVDNLTSNSPLRIWDTLGAMDDLMMWNRSLSDSEISYVYNSQLTKYDSQNWTFQTNQSPIALPTNYYLCASNSTGGETCSASETIGRITTVIANFSTLIGLTKNDFFGVNTHGSYLTTNGADTPSTLANQQVFESSGMKIIRFDATFEGPSGATDINTFSNSRAVKHKNLVTYARTHGFKVLVIMDYMPAFLANTTITGVNCTDNTNYNKTCPPTNYTAWGAMNVNYLNNISCDAATCMVEVWNEPELPSFLLSNNGNDQTNASLRSKYYNLIYNASYIAIKSAFPAMQVGGPSYAAYGVRGDTMLRGFLSNFSTSMDFISTHVYLQLNEDIFWNTLNTRLGYLNSNCTAYGANCSNIILSEYNVLNTTFMTYNNSWYAMQLASADAYGLNNYPSNISMIIYSWQNEVYQTWNESSGQYFPPFNITKNFATYCPAGSTVYTSSSEDVNLRVVSCKSNSSYSVVIVNADSANKNVTVNLTGAYPYTTIEDRVTGENYTSTNSAINLGLMDAYAIKYLGNYVAPTSSTPAEETPPEGPPLGGGFYEQNNTPNGTQYNQVNVTHTPGLNCTLSTDSPFQAFKDVVIPLPKTYMSFDNCNALEMANIFLRYAHDEGGYFFMGFRLYLGVFLLMGYFIFLAISSNRITNKAIKSFK